MSTFAVIVGIVAIAAAVFVIHRRVKRDSVPVEPAAPSGSGGDPRAVPKQEEIR